MKYQVSCPGFSIGPFEIDPVAFTLPFGDGLEIMWYALFVTTGFVVAFLYAWYRAKRNEGYKLDDLLDTMIFLILFGVIGARLYYVVMSPSEFDGFLDVLNIRSGGLAIYGGLIGGVLAILGVCRVKKMNLWRLLDMAAPGVMIAQAIGRWGNFCNGEAFGYETDIFCRMSLNNFLTGYETLMVHPCFFYESLWNIIGFVLINIFYSKRRYDGQVFVAVCGWYGLGRAWIEGLRTDSLYLPPIFGLDNLRISQVLAIGIFALCLGFLIYHAVKKTDKPLYVKANKKG